MRKFTTYIGIIAVAGFALCSCGPAPDSGAPNATVEDAEGNILVESEEAFRSAVEAAEPGDRIVLANGVWEDFDALFHAEGTEAAPIHLIAETPGEVILSGQSSLRLAGHHLIVSGLVFRDGYTSRSEVISFRKDEETLAYNSQVTNTVIDGYSNPKRSQRDLWVGMYGRNNTFNNNHLSGKQNAGPVFAVRLNTEESQQNDHRIANNYFGPRAVFGSNGGETMRIGTSHFSLTESRTVVENNYFDRCSGEVEIISNKSGSNVFRGNTFYASRGTLTLRHGNGTIVEDNLFDGAGAPYTGGVRVINARQTIRGNYFKDLTGNRFSGALVIMNGVPNSPINRYHQVDGAVVEGNVFSNVAAIELGEGSDAERTAIPINSAFRDNVVIGRDGKGPFSLYDDMSQIAFSGNQAAEGLPESLASGFDVSSGLTAPTIENKGVARDATGVAWYPKAAEGSPFGQGKEIILEPGVDILSGALSNLEPGDTLILKDGRYHESKIIELPVPVTIRGAQGAGATISFERPHLFVLTGDGALELEGIKVTGETAPDGSGNSFISTSSSQGSGNHLLMLRDMRFVDFDVNRGFSVVTASKGSFFDRIDVIDSEFEDISGTVFKLDEETDDYGIYNAEYLAITGSKFERIGGSVAAVYRGGRDESTFGPHVDVSGSSFDAVGRAISPLMVLHGIQNGSFTNNTLNDAQPLSVTYTTGLPIFAVDGNTVDGSAGDKVVNTTDLRNRK